MIVRMIGLSNKGIFAVECKETYVEKCIRDETTVNIRSILFSAKGKYLAYRTDKRTDVIRCADWSLAWSTDVPVKDMAFSPQETYLMAWELFAINKEYPQGKPNLHVYRAEDGSIVKSFTQKNQTGWEPKWTTDEKYFAMQVNQRVLIYQDGNFDQYAHEIKCDNLRTFSISPSPAPSYYFSTFSIGKSGQPSFWRIFKLPDFRVENALVSKSSFQADKATFNWNRRGTNLFTMTQRDVDKTGGSYYGTQALSYGDVKGNSGNMTFNKEGPIHAIAWNPGNWNEWLAVYGHAPAKATLFNAKCEPLFEFGTGAWNAIYFAPDGAHILFMYKIWHYTGVLMHKKNYAEKEQLLSISWKPGNYPKTELSKTPPKGIEDATTKPAQAYRPPSARNRPSNFTLHEYEKPHKPGEPPREGPSKAAIKQKEKREARKARKAEEKAQGDVSPTPPAAPRPAFVSTGDPDKDKKIKNINKKLSDIEKLKQQKAAGKQLEVNQLTKIETEAALIKELAQLRL
ncbi:Eukaryotic translation initiation factor 2A [Eumeta japonica]|uniref:Eukaryotic translation initiation factor 2A n=1 Tax=Eumeta variegata TaxID=151549 RepID=A0A4C1U919_EUMVA|nr:Eukaryotic translation initiation factor 2A [Eumeta japonica]